MMAICLGVEVDIAWGCFQLLFLPFGIVVWCSPGIYYEYTIFQVR